MPRQKEILAALLCGFALVVLAQPSAAQTLQERHDQIRAAVDSRANDTALAHLKFMRAAEPALFAANNYDYLLARLAERSGDAKSAAENYRAVIARRSLLEPYALWHLSQLARTSGDLVLERERLRQLIGIAPSSLRHDAAAMRLAQSFFESTDYVSAVATIAPLTNSKNTTIARQALALTAQAFLLNGKPTEARAAFTQLIRQMPDTSRPDDFALAAVRGVDSLEKGGAFKDARLSEAEHSLRASIYQFNRDFDAAKVYYLALISDYPQSASVPEALYQIGRGLYQQGKFADALKYLQRIEGTTPAAHDALGLIAATYTRLKRTDDAIAAYKQLIDRFPSAPNTERPYLNIIDALRDANRDNEALEWIKQTHSRFKDQIGGTLALFAQAKIHLAQGAWRTAVADLEELQQAKDLGGVRVPGGTYPAEIAFLRALALEQAGRTEEAIDAYLATPEGRNEYYGFRANERLGGLGADPRSHSIVTAKLNAFRADAKRQLDNGQAESARRAAQAAMRLNGDASTKTELLQLVQLAYAALPAYKFPSFQFAQLGRQEVVTTAREKVEPEPSHQALADELFFLGLYDEGAPEFASARQANPAGIRGTRPLISQQSGGANAPSANDIDYTLAVYSLRGDLPYPAVRFAEQTWRTIPSDYLIELAPRQMVELLYPAPYRDSLLEYAGPRSVDPRLVLSIARQESRFQPDAKSVAAARGLMQFIAATADEVAKQIGHSGFRQDDLYNPATAIEFGSQYLATLFKQFPGAPAAVAGSYNGGADNIARWIARSRTNDPDRYVAEMGFAQSKDYVFRVMANFQIYQRLYSDQLLRQ